MAWEQYARGLYYYRKRRKGRRVVSEYVGADERAQILAAIDAADRAEREASRDKRKHVRNRERSIDAQLDDLAEMTRTLTQAVLLANGYRTHKGQWRKKRNG